MSAARGGGIANVDSRRQVDPEREALLTEGKQLDEQATDPVKGGENVDDVYTLTPFIWAFISFGVIVRLAPSPPHRPASRLSLSVLHALTVYHASHSSHAISRHTRAHTHAQLRSEEEKKSTIYKAHSIERYKSLYCSSTNLFVTSTVTDRHTDSTYTRVRACMRSLRDDSVHLRVRGLGRLPETPRAHPRVAPRPGVRRGPGHRHRGGCDGAAEPVRGARGGAGVRRRGRLRALERALRRRLPEAGHLGRVRRVGGVQLGRRPPPLRLVGAQLHRRLLSVALRGDQAVRVQRIRGGAETEATTRRPAGPRVYHRFVSTRCYRFVSARNYGCYFLFFLS